MNIIYDNKDCSVYIDNRRYVWKPGKEVGEILDVIEYDFPEIDLEDCVKIYSFLKERKQNFKNQQ